jgi:hypothetical protein
MNEWPTSPEVGSRFDRVPASTDTIARPRLKNVGHPAPRGARRPVGPSSGTYGATVRHHSCQDACWRSRSSLSAMGLNGKRCRVLSQRRLYTHDRTCASGSSSAAIRNGVASECTTTPPAAAIANALHLTIGSASAASRGRSCSTSVRRTAPRAPTAACRTLALGSAKHILFNVPIRTSCFASGSLACCHTELTMSAA